MNILKRVKSPTPKFFKIIRAVGLVTAGLGSSFLASPVAMPDLITDIAGYLLVIGTAISVVSQATVQSDDGTASEINHSKSSTNE